jgi:hypothetical protein
MRQDDPWWMIEEQPFRSRLPLIGGLVVWIRETWNSVATKWYVRPLIQQQNAVNRRLSDELDALHEEILVVQRIEVDLDREQQDLRRDGFGAIYALSEEVASLRDQVAELRLALSDRPPDP